MVAKAKTETKIPEEEGTLVQAEQGGAMMAVTDFEADADVGFEGADRDSYAIPFLTILQALSPQCLEEEPTYIEGAKAGQFFNTVSTKRYDGKEGVLAIPCSFVRRFLEWAPRSSGGGFKGAHDVVKAMQLLPSCSRDKRGKDILPNGNILSDTREHYILLLDPEMGPIPTVVSMASTQIKKSKRWLSVMRDWRLKRQNGQPFNPPTFARIYRLTRIAESNDQGNWYGWQIEPESIVQGAYLYEQAKALHTAIQAGEVRAADPVDDVVSSQGGEETVEDF